MKWLIFIILISCGHHQEPGALDYQDSDGDQVLNYEETGLDKYIANFEAYGKISGVLRISTGGIVEIPFSNNVNFNEKALELLTGNEERMDYEDYFSEWSRLRLRELKSLNNLKLNYYHGHIFFEQNLDPSDEVVLITPNGEISLGIWEKEMKVSMSRENLELLKENKAYLAINKKFKRNQIFDIDPDHTIRKKTYRVFYNDGNKTQVLYVSKDLKFDGLLNYLNIRPSELKNEEELFFNTHLPGRTEWFVRHLRGNDKVLAYTNLEALRAFVRKNYHYQKQTILRENGYTKTKISFNNRPGAKVFLKIRAIEQTTRDFSTSQERKRHGGGREIGVWECTHHLRHIKSETTQPLHLTYLLENRLVTALNHAEILEQIDNEGLFWELKLNSLGENAELAINPLPAESYVVTGEYANSCSKQDLNRGTYAAYKTNIEGKLSFEVESFVEKI